MFETQRDIEQYVSTLWLSGIRSLPPNNESSIAQQKRLSPISHRRATSATSHEVILVITGGSSVINVIIQASRSAFGTNVERFLFASCVAKTS